MDDHHGDRHPHRGMQGSITQSSIRQIIENDTLEGEFKKLTKEHLETIKQHKRTKQSKRWSAILHRPKTPTKSGDSERTGGQLDNIENQDVKPDETLAGGCVLPEYFGKFPKNLLREPIEDIDPYYKDKQKQTFCMVSDRFSKKYIFRFSAGRSLFLLSPFNIFRRIALKIAVNQWFDYLVIITIIVNCVFMALDEEYTESEYVFTALYTLEMLIKVIARGFVLDNFTYLRDPWNWLDIVVILLSYVTIITTQIQSNMTDLNVSGLRAFRVFRAFKSLNIVPGLRTIVNALLTAFKHLAEVMLIMLFLLVVVSLIALQAYQGVLMRKCVYVAPSNISHEEYYNFIQNSSNWNPDAEGETVVCGNSSTTGFCPENYVCLQDIGQNPNHGYTNFDNFGYAMLTSFQLFTLDYWENVYNMIIRAEGALNVLFFIMSVFLGPFYLLNLLLAVVALAYQNEHEEQVKLRLQRAEEKRRARLKVLRKKKLLALRNQSLHNISDVAVVAIINKIESNPTSPKLGSPKQRHCSFGDNEVKKADDTLQVPEESRPNSPNLCDTNQNFNSPFNHASTKRGQFQNGQIDSLESADSKADKSKLELKLIKLEEWYLGTFCAWTCFPAFTKLQEKYLKRLISSQFFEAFIVLCIVVNTLFLAIDHHEINTTLSDVLNVGNYVFTAIFAIEAVIKLLALGVRGYVKDRWNIFDFIIVVISLVELALPSEDSGLSVFRMLRLLRVFRLAKIWDTMNRLMNIILKSVSAVGYLTIVLFLVLFSFAVIGKQLYRSKYANGAQYFDDNQLPRWRFTDFSHSFFLVWRVMCGEWIEPLYDCLLVADYTCIPVFLSITFIANFLVLNLFTAILLEAFSVDSLKKKQAEKKNAIIKKGIEGFRNLITKKKKSKSSITPDELETTIEKASSRQTINETVTTPVKKIDSSSSSLEVPSLATDGLDNAKLRISSSTTSMFTLTKATLRRKNQLPRKPKLASTPSISSESIPSDFSKASTSSEGPKTYPRQKGQLVRQYSTSGSNDTINMVTEQFKLSPSIQEMNEEIENEETEEKTCGVSFARTSKSDNIVVVKNLNGRFINSGEPVIKEDVVTPGGCCQGWSCFSSSCCRKGQVQKVSAGPSIEEGLSEKNEENAGNDGEKDKTETPDCFPKCCHCSLIPGPIGEAWTKVRNVAHFIAHHTIFEWAVLLLILASTVSLAMEDVNLKHDPTKKHVLEILEYVFTSLFTLEMIIKWFGLGFHKYFTNWWCILDAAIIAVSWASIGASASANANNIDSLRAIRTLRALRPLRAVSRWQGMKVVVNALFYCIPSIANVLCVCLLIWLVFSILGVQFFKGQFYRCVYPDGSTINYTIVANKTQCGQMGYNWTTPYINFDNALNGMLALFQVATFEGWMEVMADASDVAGVDNQPIPENSYGYYIYFFAFVLVGSFFILNLIVGVIIESFQKLRKQSDAPSAMEAFLTDNQKAFYETMRNMLNRKPKKTIPQPKNFIQKKCFRLVLDNKFEVAIFSVIVMNMLTLAMEHYHMSNEWRTALRYVDISFTTIFSIEAILKIFGLRLYYFRDPFNVFDLIVVILSIAGFVLEELLTFIVSPTLLRVVRVFRVFRVLRVVRAARGIRRLIMTLMMSLPALVNIAVLLTLFMIIFAILGMSFFMDVKLQGALNDQVNFQTFGNSFLLLFRLMTSAGWNDVLEPLMNEQDCGPQECDANGENCLVATNCGNYLFAVFYFLIYIFLVFLVIVNMYIAIILETFENIFRQEESGVSPDDFEFFYLVWGRYDPKASQFVSLVELSNLLHDLHPPFRLPKPNAVKIAALNLPIVNGDKVHCLDVLYALVRRILGEVDIPENIREEAEKKLFKSFPSRKQLKAETTTLQLRQRTKSAKIIQDAWRTFAKSKKKLSDSSDDVYLKTPSPVESRPPAHKPHMMSNIANALMIGANVTGSSVVADVHKQLHVSNDIAPTTEEDEKKKIQKSPHKFSVKAISNLSQIPTAVAVGPVITIEDTSTRDENKNLEENNDNVLFTKVERNQPKEENGHGPTDAKRITGVDRPQTAHENKNITNIKISARPKTSVEAREPVTTVQLPHAVEEKAADIKETKTNNEINKRENGLTENKMVNRPHDSPKTSKSTPNLSSMNAKVEDINKEYITNLKRRKQNVVENKNDAKLNNNNNNDKFELQTRNNGLSPKNRTINTKTKQESLV